MSLRGNPTASTPMTWCMVFLADDVASVKIMVVPFSVALDRRVCGLDGENC